MVSIDTGYDDKTATEDVSGDFAPPYGVFNAEIVDISPPGKDVDKFDVKKSSNGKPHYSAIYTFKYKNSKGEEKHKGAFIACIGLWFTPLLKQLLVATESNNSEDRTALMSDTNHLNGKKVKIVIGARKKEFGDREEFEGFEVGEYDGKKFIANEIVQIAGPKEKTDFDEEAEKNIRIRFKNSGDLGKEVKETQPGFTNDNPANF